MEEDYISISTLNDFIFCPYSIYLHNVYMESDEGLYHATPQTRGKIAHKTIDTKKASNRTGDLQSLPILSEKYKLIGKIDLYRSKDKKLIERKYQLKNIYQGQIYQLWACGETVFYGILSRFRLERKTSKNKRRLYQCHSPRRRYRLLIVCKPQSIHKTL